ncbi:hypothetical protein AB4144_32815, partial [Rhizobiaceae sp. 2RAB30]
MKDATQGTNEEWAALPGDVPGNDEGYVMRFAPRMEGVRNGNSRSAWEAHGIAMERIAAGQETFF